MRAGLAVLAGVVVVVGLVLGLGRLPDFGPAAEDSAPLKGVGEPEKTSGPEKSAPPPPPAAPPSPAPAPKRSTGLSVEGIVLDAQDRRPIAGARVEAHEGGVRTVQGRSTSSIRGPGAPPLEATLSGPDGRFRLESVPSGNPATVLANAPGYAEARQTLELVAGAEKAESVELLLPRAGLVRGTVLDPGGRPLPGSGVYAMPAGVPELLRDPPGSFVNDGQPFDLLVTKADEQARFELPGLPLGATQLLFATHPDHARSAPAEVRLTAEGAEATIQLRLQRWGSLVVRVVDEAERPTIPQEVNLFRSSDRVRHRPLERASDGSFPKLVPGPYQVQALAGEYGTVIREIEVREGGPTEVVVRLSRGASLEGRLVDDRGGPLADVRVTASPDPRSARRALGSSTGSATTDAEGRFRVIGLEAGLHQLFAQPEAHDTATLSGVDAPRDGLTMIARRRARVTARVRLPEGTAAQLQVTVLKTTKGPNGRTESATVPWRNGELEVPGFPTGPARVELIVAGLGPVARDLDAAPGETVDLGELKLDAGTTLEGVVVDGQGAPIANVEVTREEGVGVQARTRTGRDGRFRLEHVASGEVRLYLSARGYAIAAHVVPVREGEPVTIRLDRGGLLKGEVTDEDARVIAGVNVSIFDPNRSGDRTRMTATATDPLGRFEVRLPAGNYRVSAWRGTKQSAFGEASLREGEETRVVLTFRP